MPAGTKPPSAAEQPVPRQGVSNPLSKDALNLPNLITASRLVMSFILFGCIHYEGLWITSAVLFAVAASTDFLDGWIARKYGLVTALGRILDPFVDKIIVLGAFIFLLEKGAATSGVDAWMVVTVIARELFVTSLRGFLEQQGKDFSASLSGKLKMVTQSAAVFASLLSLSPDLRQLEWLIQTRDILLYAMLVVTLWSGVVYVVRGVNILRQPA